MTAAVTHRASYRKTHKSAPTFWWQDEFPVKLGDCAVSKIIVGVHSLSTKLKFALIQKEICVARYARFCIVKKGIVVFNVQKTFILFKYYPKRNGIMLIRRTKIGVGFWSRKPLLPARELAEHSQIFSEREAQIRLPRLFDAFCLSNAMHSIGQSIKITRASARASVRQCPTLRRHISMQERRMVTVDHPQEVAHSESNGHMTTKGLWGGNISITVKDRCLFIWTPCTMYQTQIKEATMQIGVFCYCDRTGALSEAGSAYDVMMLLCI